MKKIMRVTLVHLLAFILTFDNVKATHQELDAQEMERVKTSLKNHKAINIDQVLDDLYVKYTPNNPMKIFEEIARTGKAVQNGITYTGDQKKIQNNFPSALRTGINLSPALKISDRGIKNGVFSITYSYQGAGIYRSQHYMLTLSTNITDQENEFVNPLHATIVKKNTNAAAAATRPDGN